MLYGDVDFKILSDRYTNRRMVPFLTHIDGVRAKSSAKNDPDYGKSTVVVVFCCCCCFFFFFLFFFFLFLGFFFFTVKLDATNSFPSNTAGIRPSYLKMGGIMRKPVFVICEQQKRRSACASTQSDQGICCSLPG